MRFNHETMTQAQKVMTNDHSKGQQLHRLTKNIMRYNS